MTSLSPRSWLKWWRSASRSARGRNRRTVARLNLELLEERQLLATFTVTNANNSGTGSLRQAILNANNTSAADVIQFSVGSGPRDLVPTSPLPEIVNPVTLDGTTQPGYIGTPLITISGHLAGPFSEGLVLRGSDSIVRALTIRSFNGHGIVLYGNSNAIERSYIGIDPFQTFGAGNRDAGVAIENGANNVLRDNVISGNLGRGVMISGTNARSNVVESSYIGTDATGTVVVQNGGEGVLIGGGASLNTVGGGPRANVISGNAGPGVALIGSGTIGNEVWGNYLGTNASGTAALGNLVGVFVGQGARLNSIGIVIPGGRNLISGNRDTGVVLADEGTSNNTVRFNFIGTNAAGTAAVPNQRDGVSISNGARDNTIGGTFVGAGNIISGNQQHGVALYNGGTRGNVVQGNYIGITFAGDAPLGNNVIGVFLAQGANQNTIGGSSALAGNVISANRGPGVKIRDNGTNNNVVLGNSIGTNASGTAALPNSQGVQIVDGASNNTIGGTVAGAGNLISGNQGEGVAITDASTVNNVVQGNWIGTNAAGSTALGNHYGVFLLGARNNLILGNVIAANRDDGINIQDFDTVGNVVRGNFIGTDNTLQRDLGNARNGIALIQGDRNIIGGMSLGAANAIAFNRGSGVVITSGTGNAILGNWIGTNGGLGIDLGRDGVTANDPGDADTGANNLQNFPVLTSATISSSQTVITGTLNSTAGTTFQVDLFAVLAAPVVTYPLGAVPVITDSAGNGSFTFALNEPLPTGTTVTVTATRLAADGSGDTSEFSAALAVGTSETLQVGAFTPSSAGFTATFSQPIFAGDLNLYDTQTDNFGPADVTVTGAATGPVRGSLVVNAAGTSIRFLATGDLLPPDTYTVVLRSAANGFHTAAGDLLDGNADGTPGGDFTTTFTVAPSTTAIVSVPDFVRGPGQPVDVPGGSFDLPLCLSDGAGVTAVRLTLHYDPALLSIIRAAVGSGVPAGATVTINSAAPGQVILTFTSPTPLSSGAIDFVRLQATVPNTAPYASKQVLDLSNVQVNGIAARDNDGLHVAGYFGDASGNAAYSSVDAARVLRVAVGLDSGFGAYQLADPLILADITGNGILNSSDATRILQEAIGLDQLQIPPLPGVIPPIVPGGPDPLLSLPKDIKGRPGEVITIPVNLDISEDLEAVDLALSYDALQLELLSDDDVQPGSLTEDFDLFLVNHDPVTGNLRVGLGRTAGPLQGRGSGSVLELRFRIKSDAPQGKAVVNLRENLEGTRTLLNEGGLVLYPEPLNEAGDVLDGIITVQSFSTPTIESVVIKNGVLATRITVTFSTVVRFLEKPTAAFRLIGPQGAVRLRAEVATDANGARTVVRLTFAGRRGTAGSLADGRYTLTIDADRIVNADGTAVDGDGDGTAGGDAVEKLFRVYNDSDSKRDIDDGDLGVLTGTLGK